MPVICWAPLAKSAQDSTTIADYIAGKILEHNVDPSAHNLDSYALYNHRDDPYFDHPDYAITSDKITTDWIVSKKFSTSPGVGPGTDGVVFDPYGIMMYQAGVRKVNIPKTGEPEFAGNIQVAYLTFSKFVLMSFFESIDGFEVLESGGSIFAAFGGCYFESSAANGSYLAFSTNPGNIYNFAKNPLFLTTITIDTITNVDIYIYAGAGYGDFEPCFGFKWSGGELYAYTSDGTSVTSELIDGYNFFDRLRYSAIMKSGSKVDFYINQTLVATITTNLPTGVYARGVTWQAVPAAIGGTIMAIHNIIYVQDN